MRPAPTLSPAVGQVGSFIAHAGNHATFAYLSARPM
jgi:hypothetical protein